MSFSLPLNVAPIKRLMANVVPGGTVTDDKWKEKAIKSLVKKLRKTNQLEVFEQAISSKDSSVVCVKIPRSLDGRLQVGPRKGWPHVFYCQLFRWPDLQSQHELRPIPTCTFSFHRKCSEVCVNPYHYVRVENPSILVPSFIPMTPTSATGESSGSSNKSSLEDYSLHNLARCGKTINNGGNVVHRSQMTHSPTNNQAITGSPTPISSSDVLASSIGVSTKVMGELKASPDCHAFPPAESLHNNTYVLTQSDPMVVKMETSSPLSQDSDDMKMNDKMDTDLDSGHIAVGSYESKRQMSEDTVTSDMEHEASAASRCQVGSPDSNMFQERLSPISSALPANTSQFHNSLLLSERFYQRPGSSTASEMSGMSGVSGMPLLTPVDYHVLEDWCSVHYYEYNTRVGDTFRCCSSRLIVDGYTNPNTSDRFCLGMLSNVKREVEAEITRRHIGKGITLFFLAGEVIVECNGDNAIFVQSPNCNYMNEWHLATVVKVPPGCNLTIFDNALFAKLLKQYVNHSYEAVFELNKMCILRISFVKGWGSSYKRQNITSTPCWIEIHLHGPLQWLDRILRQMGSSIKHCSSMS